MDEIDRKILNILQEDFPITESPFEEMSKILGLTEDEVIGRVSRLKDNGVIRRIGAVLNADALGIVTTLCAAKVLEEKIDTFADVVNSSNRVTHNYQRNGNLNIWFTLWGRDEDELSKTIAEIKERTGIDEIYRFPKRKTYKIRAVFDPIVKDPEGEL